MDLELSPEDFELLKRVLDRYVSDLRMEIAGTENATWRKEMHADEDRAKDLLNRLNAPKPSSRPSDHMRIAVRGFVFIP